MKLLTQTLSQNDAQALKSRIERAGIPIVVSGAYSHHVPFKSGLVSVWVAIASQYGDAVIALENPQHVAEQPVDVEAFHLAVRQQSLVPGFMRSPAFWTYTAIAVFVFFLIRAVVIS